MTRASRSCRVAALVQRPLTSIISLGSKHITNPAQLRGKTVGDAGIPYQHAYLDTILQQAGVPGELGQRGQRRLQPRPGDALRPGRRDARRATGTTRRSSCARWASRPNVIHVENVGVPTYDELVLVARESEIANHTNMLRRFVQALGRGYESVRRDPAAGVDALVNANPSLDRTLQLASVRATLPALLPARTNKPWGWQDPRTVERLRPVDARPPPDLATRDDRTPPRPTSCWPGQGP